MFRITRVKSLKTAKNAGNLLLIWMNTSGKNIQWRAQYLFYQGQKINLSYYLFSILLPFKGISWNATFVPNLDTPLQLSIIKIRIFKFVNQKSLKATFNTCITTTQYPSIILCLPTQITISSNVYCVPKKKGLYSCIWGLKIFDVQI